MNDKRPPELLYPNLAEERQKQRAALEESLRQSGCVADANEGQAKCKKEELLAADKGEASHTDPHPPSRNCPCPECAHSFPEDEIADGIIYERASHSQTSATAKTEIAAPSKE